MSKCRLIRLVSFGNPNNFCFGNDEDMDRCLWFNILNCNTGIILVQNFGGDFPVNNFFKNTDKLLDWISKSSGQIKVRPDQKLFMEKQLNSREEKIENVLTFIDELEDLNS